MESARGILGVKDLKESGTPVEVIEGDGDNTTISRLRSEHGRCVKIHVVKTIGKQWYSLFNEKTVKINNTVILYLQKCLKYIFYQNQENEKGRKENLKAVKPHQFGGHTLCKPVFCGYLRKPTEKYLHRSMPYKPALKEKKYLLKSARNIWFSFI